MRPLEEARSILDKHGYALSFLQPDTLQFEDDALLGFICELPLQDILQSWNRRQDAFLTHNATSLRNSALKAWNLYSVFLTADRPNEREQKQLVDIQEDFRATRKIVHAAVETSSDVVRALYPFIPIQNVAALETTDSVRKLRGRLTGLPSKGVDALLDEHISTESLIRLFRESHENKTD
jgi:hypothetical protein